MVEERARIARELHDVVAHHVSLIGVQAGAARTALDRSPDSARVALAGIEASSRAAVSITTEFTGDPTKVPPTVSLCSYRIVEEALTNVVRHSAAVSASVRVHAGDVVEIVIDDPRTGTSTGRCRAGHGSRGHRATRAGGPVRWNGCRARDTDRRVPRDGDDPLDGAVTDPAAIRVVLCDDHPAMRAAFRMILEASDIAVVGEAGDGDAAVAVVALERPDVVLMDVRMPGRDGISAIAEIVSTFPQCRVLVLRRSTTTCSMALDRSVAARVFARFAVVAATPDVSTVHSSALDRLTERERDVLWLMAQGMTNLEIAHRLDVAEATVKTHVSRLLTELAVRDRVQAVIHAYRSGFARVDRRLG